MACLVYLGLIFALQLSFLFDFLLYVSCLVVVVVALLLLFVFGADVFMFLPQLSPTCL